MSTVGRCETQSFALALGTESPLASDSVPAGSPRALCRLAGGAPAPPPASLLDRVVASTHLYRLLVRLRTF